MHDEPFRIFFQTGSGAEICEAQPVWLLGREQVIKGDCPGLH